MSSPIFTLVTEASSARKAGADDREVVETAGALKLFPFSKEAAEDATFAGACSPRFPATLWLDERGKEVSAARETLTTCPIVVASGADNAAAAAAGDSDGRRGSHTATGSRWLGCAAAAKFHTFTVPSAAPETKSGAATTICPVLGVEVVLLAFGSAEVAAAASTTLA